VGWNGESLLSRVDSDELQSPDQDPGHGYDCLRLLVQWRVGCDPYLDPCVVAGVAVVFWIRNGLLLILAGLIGLRNYQE
jgi:hypothetical protein